MEGNNKKEKKALKLKIKTFADLKRFTSKQLHKIVEKWREKNKDLKDLSLEEILRNEKWTKAMKVVIRQSLINRSDRKWLQRAKAINDKKEDLQEDIEQYNEDVREGKITGKEQQKAYNKLNDRVYKINKEMYTRDLGPADQAKPKNPMIQRAIKNVGKVVKTVGKGLGVAVAAPFVIGYKIATGIGRGVKAIGRGGKVAALTAGKVTYKGAKAVGQTIKETSKEVKETDQARRKIKNIENRKDLGDNVKFAKKEWIYDTSSKATQEAIYEDDYKAALKENAKREREAARRAKLHMSEEQQPINHEEAMKKTEENSNEQEKEEEK